MRNFPDMISFVHQKKGVKMSEQEAKHIYDHKLSLCRVFGGDVRQRCLEAGVPAELIDKFERNDAEVDTLINRLCDLEDWTEK